MTIGTKLSHKENKQCCGMFYSAAKDGKWIGNIYKLAEGRYVSRGIEEYSCKVLWESAEFTGKEFRKFDQVNLGYGTDQYFTAR